MSRRPHVPVAVLSVFLVLAGCTSEAEGPDPLESVFAADDRRGSTREDVQALVAATLHDDSRLRTAAVRALGRLERPDMVGAILAALDDPDADVRAMAAFAAAQAVRGTSESSLVVGSLRRVMGDDDAPSVRAAAAVAMGRLPYATQLSAGESERQLVAALTAALDQDPGHPLVPGAARGLDALLRGRIGAASDSPAPLVPGADTLAALTRTATEAAEPEARRRAVSALVSAGAVAGALAARLLQDDDFEVRRLAMRGLTVGGGDAAAADFGDATDVTDTTDGDGPTAARTSAVDRALRDPALTVRIEGWRAARRVLSTAALCSRVEAGLRALPEPPLALEIVTAAADCLDTAPLLRSLAQGLDRADVDGWHVPLAALETLARLEPGAGRRLLGAAADHPVWQVRMHVAAALGRAADASPAPDPDARAAAARTLTTLAADSAPNVRTAALRSLAPMDPAAATAGARQALTTDAPELLMVAAGILAEHGDSGDHGLVLEALERTTADATDTSRDARVALLRAAAAAADASGTGVTAPAGEPELAPDLETALTPYLHDHDPRIAELAAELLGARGVVASADPQPLAPVPVPPLAELERIGTLDWAVQMEGGGRFVIRLWPLEAPTNAARFARLAEAGAFDGLTFHRVVPNFVIQGLSPGANEYAGYPRYTRDEITPRGHEPGTVGISTRGRDTGDGQIFVNLAANYRLDFDYTLIGEVVAGFDVVVRVLEGDRVASVTPVPR